MFENVLSKFAKESLAVLGKSHLLDKSYLGGGTALALQLGHRVSEDFDFFIRKKFQARTLARNLKKTIPDFDLEKVAWGTIFGYIRDIKFTIFFYDYPLLFKTKRYQGVDVADFRDIAAMKIAAIADRGTKRDFIDLYFLIKDKIVTPEDSLGLYEKKFKKLEQNKIHIIKSLTYFEDAENDNMPGMIREVGWEEVKRFIEGRIKKLSNKLLK